MTDKQREAFDQWKSDFYGEPAGLDIWQAACKWQAQQAAGAEPWSIEDDVFADEFAQWWEDHGQYVKSGGGRYERYFAFEAWRYLYPLTIAPQPPKAEPELLSNIKELPPGFKPHAQQHKEVPMVTYGPDQAGGGQFGICVQCGKGPTPEGHDGCLGTLPGPIMNACCGHGRASTAYIQYREEDSKEASIIEGVDALLEQNRLISIRDGQPSKAVQDEQVGHHFEPASDGVWRCNCGATIRAGGVTMPAYSRCPNPGPSTTACDDQEAPDE